MSMAKDELEALRMKQEEILTGTTRQLWQSIEDRSGDWETIKARRGKEFSVLPIEREWNQSDSPSSVVVENPGRRKFLQWTTAASALLASTACTRRPVDHLVPYTRKPEGLTYGVPQWYASTSASGFGLLIKTREGKPIKLEGNPDHPVNQGGLDSQTQASLFDLYNPDRLKAPLNVKTTTAITWSDVDSEMKKVLADAPAGSVRVLTGPVVSPSLRSSLDRFVSKSGARHHVTENIPTDPIAEAYEVLSGQKIVPTFQFDAADVIVSVDADFLGTWIRPLEFTKSFSKRRKIHRGDSNVNKLFVFESVHSLTGVAADERHSIRPSQQTALLMALGAEVSARVTADASAKSLFGGASASQLASQNGLDLAAVRAAAAALVQARGKALVVAGGRGANALADQILAAGLNSILGAAGSTLDFSRPMILGIEKGASYAELKVDIEKGGVSALIIQGVNPVYTDREFAGLLSKVKAVFTMSPELTETAAVSSFALPESHYLEAWGDTEIRQGVYSVQQPVIEPLYSTRSFAEALESWSSGSTANYRDQVVALWKREFFTGGDFTAWWNDVLKSGAVTRAGKGSAPAMKWAQGQSVVSRVKFTKPEGLELALIPSINLRDGSSANNPYIQELPDPITKITWDNYVGVSPKFAAKMGLNENLIDGEAKTKELPSDFRSELVEVTVNGQSIVLPVFVQTGLDENVVSIQLGYGRTSAGQIGSGVGKNAFVFAASNAGQTQFRGMSVSLKKVSGRYELASTQKQFDLQGRDSDILQQHSLKDFLAHSGEHKKHPSADLYNEKEWVYPGHRWGMAIDLNSCTGCNACVVACYTENNVSTVGRDEVIMGRHQAWMRLDLYHSGDARNPVSAFEPMLCQQCANAPCETVCPVLATVHSSDGLNDMSYNRCVGTRYCANNCPYKVRRFNWFQYSDKLANKVTKVDPLPLMINPDVSVRTRGVMEKCTFCVQRIRNGVDETVQSRMKRVPDGHIKTACQQSCPADAIVFGDLNDPESEVSKLAHAKGGFKVLEILNTKPSVTYLPRIRNRDSV